METIQLKVAYLETLVYCPNVSDDTKLKAIQEYKILIELVNTLSEKLQASEKPSGCSLGDVSESSITIEELNELDVLAGICRYGQPTMSQMERADLLSRKKVKFNSYFR